MNNPLVIIRVFEHVRLRKRDETIHIFNTLLIQIGRSGVVFKDSSIYALSDINVYLIYGNLMTVY